jgi:serine/threonine protein kinase
MSSLDNFKIIQMVAKGGTAILYKAIQTSLDRTVAIKKLHQHLTDDENFTRRFILEAKAAASLDHENIVHVIDFGKSDGDYQIVMEYVEGRSLIDILKEKKRLSPLIALSIVYQICLGLEHAHAKGIVHRDIKPGNILIAHYGRVKITDFGLAKLAQSTTQQTAADSLLGTPLYMSPEQAYGESVDARSDIFSLGTMLYEMLTGEQPFFSENCMGVLNNIIHCDVTPLSEIIEEIPDGVERITMKALSKNREGRFQSAEEFRKCIEDFAGIVKLKEAEEQLPALLVDNTQTVILTDTPAPLRSRRGRRGRRRPVIAIFGVLLAIIAVAAVIHLDIISDSVKRLLGPAERAPVVMRIDESSLSGAPSTLPFTDPANDTASTAGLQARAGVVDTVNRALAARDDTPPTQALLSGDSTPVPETAIHAVRTVAPATAAPTAAVEAPPVKNAAVQKGWLSVSTKPWAAVYIDGSHRTDTPPTADISLPAGRHTLECRNPQHEIYREEIHITAGELSRRTITLKKLQGTIQLFTEPGSEFYLDGKLYGITPLSGAIEVDAGPHQLTIKKQGYNTWFSEVSIEANQAMPLRIRLSPQF